VEGRRGGADDVRGGGRGARVVVVELGEVQRDDVGRRAGRDAPGDEQRGALHRDALGGGDGVGEGRREVQGGDDGRGARDGQAVDAELGGAGEEQVLAVDGHVHAAAEGGDAVQRLAGEGDRRPRHGPRGRGLRHAALGGRDDGGD